MELYIIGIWSLIVNTIIKTFYSAIHYFVLSEITFDQDIKNAIYIITSVVLAFLMIKIRNSKFIERLFNKINRKTVNQDILDDVLDHEKKNVVIVYLKDSSFYYIGTLRLREEKGLSSYIALIEYCLCNKNDDKIKRDYSEQKSSVIINLQDIERMELFYENDSKKWNWLKDSRN